VLAGMKIQRLNASFVGLGVHKISKEMDIGRFRVDKNYKER
jgi:hypothetical protein